MHPFSTSDELIDGVLTAVKAALCGDWSVWDALDERIAVNLHLSAAIPLLWLRTRQNLSPSEFRIVCVFLAFEIDQHIRTLLGEGDVMQKDMSLSRAQAIACPNASRLQIWHELGDQSRLRRTGYLDRTDGEANVSAHRQTFKVSNRVLALAHADVRIASDLVGIESERSTAKLEELAVDADLVARIKCELSRKGKKVLVTVGKVGTGRRSLHTAIAQQNGMRVLSVDARKLSTQRSAAAAELRAIGRECSLLNLVPLVLNADALESGDQVQDRVDLLESELGELVLATSKTTLAKPWKCFVEHFELKPLTAVERAAFWQKLLPGATASDGQLLATMYPMAPAMMRAVASGACDRASGANLTPELITASVRATLDDRLSQHARRLEVTQTWNDFVLSEDQHIHLKEFVARVRGRSVVYEQWGFGAKVGKGLGVAALFSGPPGTGKTMVAGLLARELNLEIYQVDTSKITSKWIGETEKNLAALFDAAEACHAVLLFDEADALFGKRSDVKSSNDRHANAEVNYLLQRMESFTGICILTTNHESALDPAFQRRLSIHLKFPMPDAEEREKLWRAMLPSAAPVNDDIDFYDLARRFEMTGGYIRNAALRAAFLAADENSVISEVHLEQAARMEYEGMGKIAAPSKQQGSSWTSSLSSSL